jgi:alpha-1,6-mannosyltransferase
MLVVSAIGSFTASLVFLGVSSLNYSGGEALFRLHELVARGQPTPSRLSVHLDVLACMTGVSRFQQDFPSPPLTHRVSQLFHPFLSTSNSTSYLVKNATPGSSTTLYEYDKTESPNTLLDPKFWAQFDYVLAEHPEAVIGQWEVVDTVFGYGGMEILRPGQQSRSGVEEARMWRGLRAKEQDVGTSHVNMDVKMDEKKWDAKESSCTIVSKGGIVDEVESLGIYGMLRERIRRCVTRGWWVGPRIEAKIRILKRMK